MSVFYLSPESDRYYLSKAFTYGDFQYPATSATDEIFTSLGFTKVDVDPIPDQRFYTVIGPDDTGSYTATPKDLDSLKINFKERERQVVKLLLSETDWYVIRYFETSEAIPEVISSIRGSVRTLYNQRRDGIEATTSVEDLKTLIDTPVIYPSLFELDPATGDYNSVIELDLP